MISAHDVEHAGFGRAKEGKSGYDEVAVDDFLDRVVATLHAIEQGNPVPEGALSSMAVVEAIFPEKDASVDGGYDLDDVDDLLDRVAQRLFEHEKQVSGGGTPASVITPVADDPGEIVDNDRAERDHVDSGQESRVLTSESGESAGVATGVVSENAADASSSPSGAAGDYTSAPSERKSDDSDLAAINPVGGEAVEESAGKPDVKDEHGVEAPSASGVSSESESAAVPGVSEPTFGDAVVASSASDSEEAATLGEKSAFQDNGVEQYPATDRRVPLPRVDVADQLTDEDLRAQQNYHPEFSEYDSAEAARRAEQSHAVQVPEGERVVRADQPGVVTDARAESGGVAGAQAAEAASPQEVSSPSETVHDAPVETTDAGVAPAKTPAGLGAPATFSGSADSVQTQAAVSEVNSGSAVSTSSDSTAVVARPEGIERPEPIDRPRELPKRQENTRKGLFRRLFRG